MSDDPPAPLEMSADDFVRVRDFIGGDRFGREHEVNQRVLIELLESARRIETLLGRLAKELRRIADSLSTP